MFWDEVTWEVISFSYEAPSGNKIIFSIDERINSALSLGHVTGEPDTSRHYPDGCFHDGDGGWFTDKCGNTSSF
jgi:hypothetical protein